MRSKWTNELNHSEECLHAVGERGIRGWEDLSKDDNALHCSGQNKSNLLKAKEAHTQKLLFKSSYSEDPTQKKHLLWSFYSKALTLNFSVWSIYWKKLKSSTSLSALPMRANDWTMEIGFPFCRLLRSFCGPFVHRTQKRNQNHFVFVVK